MIPFSVHCCCSRAVEAAAVVPQLVMLAVTPDVVVRDPSSRMMRETGRAGGCTAGGRCALDLAEEGGFLAGQQRSSLLRQLAVARIAWARAHQRVGRRAAEPLVRPSLFGVADPLASPFLRRT